MIFPDEGYVCDVPADPKEIENMSRYYVYVKYLNELYEESSSNPSEKEKYEDDTIIISFKNDDDFTPEDALRFAEKEFEGYPLVYIAVCEDEKCKEILLDENYPEVV